MSKKKDGNKSGNDAPEPIGTKLDNSNSFSEASTGRDTAKSPLSSASDENQELRRLLNSSRAEVVATQKSLLDAQFGAARLAAEIQALRLAEPKQAETIVAYAIEREAMTSRLSMLTDTIEELRAIAGRAQTELKSANEKVDALRGQVAATEQRFEKLLSTLRRERDRATSLRSEMERERDAHKVTVEDAVVERTRRASIVEFLGTAGVPLAMRNPIGAFARKYSKGAMAGAVRELMQSDLFDEIWYAEQYPEAVKELHPAVHYLLYGGHEGFNPGPNFFSEAYLATNPDVRVSGMNPLLHYLRWGVRELRSKKFSSPSEPGRGISTDTPTKYWERPKAPPMSFFYDIAEHRSRDASKQGPIVDVIVPVYRSYDDTLACIASVLTSSNNTRFELVVIDDCSPEPEVSAALDEISQIGLITLLRNRKNLGFVGTVNRGMSLHEDRDVVLLNSDTLVFNDWLDRMLAHVRAGEKIATVTPFTNSGTICSYPNFCRDNKEAFDLEFEAIDQLFRQVNAGKSVVVPTGVGFCLYIARSALQELGLFDEATFGRGYGEENDFCMRAIASGWSNLHALDVFVFHSGETSFAESAGESKRRGLLALQQKHPEYDRIVRTFIARDPARAARVAIDVVRLLGFVPIRTTLCIGHTSGGGIERFLRDYSDAERQNGHGILLFVPSIAGTTTGRITAPASRESFPNLDGLDLVRDAETLRLALAMLRVRKLEIHSTVGWSIKVVPLIERFALVCGVGYSVMLHDYVPICPQINLINETGVYCGEEGVAQCTRCLVSNRDQPKAIHPDIPDGRILNIAAWREVHGKFLSGARSVSAPSADTVRRYKRYFPRLDIECRPHVEDLSYVSPIPIPLTVDERIRIGVIGAIGPHKGSEILRRCAIDARDRQLPIDFVVIGYTNIDGDLSALNVKITGRYDEDDVGEMLVDQQVDLIFLPSVWPETFCYTLSVAIASELPICVFDLGAQADRLRGRDRSLLLPLSTTASPSTINDLIVEFSSRSRRQPGFIPFESEGVHNPRKQL